MGWGSIYKRRLKVFAAALLIYMDYKALQQREKWSSKVKREAMWERAHERNAKRVLGLIIELEGLWVKLGQYLSTRADVLPQAYISLLKQLQDSLPPRPLKEVYQTIQKEFGKSIDELFSSFADSPLATASIAQVHRATMINGQEVVVKVQHDGIKTIILEDLKNAKSIVDWIAWAEPQYDFNPMIDEWCKEAPKELDFNNEAENTRKVAINLGCRDKNKGVNSSSNRVDVLMPEIFQSSEKVLILEYMDGIRLNDLETLERHGVDKQRIVEEITRAYGHQIYIDGLFNGDPHPGNFLVSKELPHRPILLDFGLTKLLSFPIKQALAKMFLAAAEGDQVALLSALAEMGLKLRLDIPEQAMEVTTVFFRTSTPADEALETMKSLGDQRTKNMKVIQEKLKLNQKEVKRFNPVDAFPGDIVIFTRVLNLLRGLSSSLNVRIVYLDIMRPFAEHVLQGNIYKAPALNSDWIHDTPVHSSVENKLRKLLVDLGNNDRILGIQVCAYKDGDVIIDTSAGVLGRYDPRPVQPDSLFPVFSVTKGITAGMLHWLVDRGKLKLDENVANIWPEFGCNEKDGIKVHHILNHTSGLHNALADMRGENPMIMYDWDECLRRIAASVPETEPGQSQLYHYLSFGWLCGGIIEHASGRKFQEILEEAVVGPLNVEGELYIGIPPGVESRLASLTLDREDVSNIKEMSSNRTDLPSSFQGEALVQMVETLPVMFNMLNTRRAIIPAANGHCSARALARYYAALVDGGLVPPPHSSSSSSSQHNKLGSHVHIPNFSSTAAEDANKGKKGGGGKSKGGGGGGGMMYNMYQKIPTSLEGCHRVNIPSDDRSSSSSSSSSEQGGERRNMMFDNNGTRERLHESFMGEGEEYGRLALNSGEFGLGFRRIRSKDGSVIGFGHSGMGGSTGFCVIGERFSIAITVNKMSLGGVTKSILELVCSELGISLSDALTLQQTSTSGGQASPSMPLIH